MTERVATLRELTEWYTFEEAKQMHEALYVRNYNQWLANKRSAAQVEKAR